MITLHAAFPPNAHFGGFPGWCEGDHDTVESNIRWHFLEHVLSIAEVKKGTSVKVEELSGVIDEPVEVFPAESAMWWQRLSIALDLKCARSLSSGGVPPKIPAYRNHAIHASTALTSKRVLVEPGKVMIYGFHNTDEIVFGRYSHKTGAVGISAIYIALDPAALATKLGSMPHWALT